MINDIDILRSMWLDIIGDFSAIYHLAEKKVGSEGMSEYNKSKISLAVIDSGVNLQHPDFKDDAI